MTVLSDKGKWLPYTVITGLTGVTFVFDIIHNHENIGWVGYLLSLVLALFIMDGKRKEEKLRKSERRVAALEEQRRKAEAEKAAREVDGRYRDMLESINMIAVMLDAAGRITFVNNYLLRLTGYNSGEVVGHDWFDIFIKREDRAIRKNFFREIFQTGIVAPSSESKIVTKRGDEVQVSWSNSLIRGLEGDAVGITYIGQDVTEKKKLERQKADFLAMLTHDLRSPLLTILAYTELLLDGKNFNIDDKAREMLLPIRQSGARLLKLAEDFLTISSVEAGNVQLRVSPVEVSSLLEGVERECAALADKSGLNLMTDIEDGLPRLLLDRNQMERVLVNLLNNAIKYTPKGGIVLLKAGKDCGKVVISVSDTGKGINENERERVFGKYYRSPKASGIRGTGLGLAIVKAITEAHGGNVELESEAGKGSEFRVVLPAGVPTSAVSAQISL